jgi:hypothetical protein
MKKLFYIVWVIILMVAFFFPAVISFVTWNFWYMLLFFVSWIPTLALFYIGLLLIPLGVVKKVILKSY